MKLPTSYKRVWMLAAALLFCSTGKLKAEGNPQDGKAVTIQLGTQVFQVGMSKTEAMSRLALCCKLSGGDDSFSVMSKEAPSEIY